MEAGHVDVGGKSGPITGEEEVSITLKATSEEDTKDQG